MSERFALHVVALLLLMLLGLWFAYRSIYDNTLAGLFTVMYWFGYLVYVFVVSSFYLLLRRRSGKSLIMAHLFSALIGAIATVVVMQMGQQYEAQKQALVKSEQQSIESK